MKSPLALAALVAAVGLAGPALAQDTTSSQPPATITGPNGTIALSAPDDQNGPADPNAPDDRNGPNGHRWFGMGMGPGMMGPGRHMLFDRNGDNNHGAGLLNLVCSDRGAERLDVAFVHLSYRLDLTADQQTLFDALRTTALTAQTTFADACKSARPAAGDKQAPDMIASLKAQVAIDQARVTALNDVLPDLQAFFDSLTDAQKARLQPHHAGPGGKAGDIMKRGGMSRNDVGRGDVGRSDMGRDARPAAPGR